ncbi:MAG: hypothetical protein ABIR58_05255 [Gemmatimonadaceae bacterium]
MPERASPHSTSRFLRDLEPTLRYAGQPSEHLTMFVIDPSGNALEFKSFGHPEHVLLPERQSRCDRPTDRRW